MWTRLLICFSFFQDLLDEDVNSLVEEEDCIGCPLPSTPEDENLLDHEVSNKKKLNFC